MDHDIKKILCPVDFSVCSDVALTYAIALAKRFDASIEALHVWQLSTYASVQSELAKGLEDDLRKDLDAALAKHAGEGVRIHGHLRRGVPYQVLVEAAKELHCDIIVMGTTGKSGFEHFLLGSVAERVIRAAECPVLTVRHKGE